MTDQPPPQPPPHGPPGWGPGPSASQPPPPPPRRHRARLILAAAGGSVVLLPVVVAVLAANSPSGPRATVATSAPVTTVEATPTSEEPVTTSEPETTEAAPSGPPVARAGETLTMTDGAGDKVADITVGGPTSPSHHHGVRFSTGDEFNKPDHGLYLGMWVKVKAFQDGVDTPFTELHVAQGGTHYDAGACCPEGFKPDLGYKTLSKGETAQGWVIFDVASRHGEVVITDFDSKRLGAWKF